MHPFALLTALLAGLSLSTAEKAGKLAGYGERVTQAKARVEELRHSRAAEYHQGASRDEPQQRTNSPYLNADSKKFVVNGSALPDVDFDIGESYAGLLPISNQKNETRELFFWFFPSENPEASKEITVWLNGGPGCSSLIGLLTENGPFLWQPGTYLPTKNPYSWTNLTNMLYLEQPVGVGFSQGEPDVTDEIGLSQEFVGFYKNFEKVFQVKDHSVYVTGESYAGFYGPYISDALLTAGFDVKGLMLYDPFIGDPVVQFEVANTAYFDHWANVFSLNASATQQLHSLSASCGYDAYLAKHLTFPPPPGPFDVIPFDPNCDVNSIILAEASLVNPCLNQYHILDVCPFTWSVLGDAASGWDPPAATNYFARADVQKAINAPLTPGWQECTSLNVFGGPHNLTRDDASSPPALNGVLKRVVEKTNNTMIGSGGLDFVIITNGTLLALQNMTWNGMQGFQTPPTNELIAPYHVEVNTSASSGAGVAGSWVRERGLTFFQVDLAGHMVPQYQAGAAFRSLEVLLGRVANLGSMAPFTTQAKGGKY